ncbi:hypothetical protein FQN54_005843 [Arachnomyces sp. PD_36]|nr:hypothetical protein FQN54_005843 [Arachnomyces sp. PD_36]
MADQHAGAPDEMSLDKGKGKAVEDTPMGQDMSMDEDDSSDEDSGNEDLPVEAEDEDDGQDTLEPIDESNIISGRRTRGKTIDYAEAAAKTEAAGDQDLDDDDDDEDFQAKDDDEMQM